ncbi:ABC transporter permease [Sporosarcina sp. E16_3]|uniref:ABC transporter permease n=1 Tax=Sporosarcina sp. E16_3 TaxID=2789293 RepID=UPI001A920431|nr:ABC transporter permease [Sporosarcina sp. E16_3]MBO0603599.1 ABC transporter permease [Sporosarcina sp. E16_3]
MILAWKEIRRNKVRYFLISTIMVAILFLVFFITALSNGLGYADSAAMSNLKADYVVLNKEANGVLIKSGLSNKDIQEIEKKVEGDVSSLNVSISTLDRERKGSVDVVYFTVNKETYGNPLIIEGKDIEELLDGEVIADESLKKFGYSLNEKVKDSRTGKEMKIAGFTKDHVYSHMPVIFADLSMGFQSMYSDTDIYNAVLVKGADFTIAGYDVQTVQDTVNSMPGYAETQGSFIVMKTFLIIISVFVSSVFFYIITIQKVHQLGILKALGATTVDISKTILFQVSALTLVGIVVSAFAFYGIVQVMPEEMPIAFSANMMIWTGILFLVLNMIGAMLSVWKVTKIDPLDAMGRVE